LLVHQQIVSHVISKKTKKQFPHCSHQVDEEYVYFGNLQLSVRLIPLNWREVIAGDDPLQAFVLWLEEIFGSPNHLENFDPKTGEKSGHHLWFTHFPRIALISALLGVAVLF
jgi:hypothetical protein